MASAIYEILNTVNGKFYIGSAVDYKRRFQDHRKQLKKGNHGNVHLQRSCNKHGLEAFIMFPVEFCTPEELLRKEQFWLDALQVTKSGYNIAPTAGSNLGIKYGPPSEEHRRKISEATKGRPNATAFKPGDTPWIKGKKHTVETRAKIGAVHKGRSNGPCSEETKRKISEAQVGKVLSAEHRRKLSLAHKGKTNGPLSEETKRKIGEKTKARWADKEYKDKVRKAMKGRPASPSSFKKGYVPTDETREKLRTSHLGQAPSSTSFRKGHVPWNKGKRKGEA